MGSRDGEKRTIMMKGGEMSHWCDIGNGGSECQNLGRPRPPRRPSSSPQWQCMVFGLLILTITQALLQDTSAHGFAYSPENSDAAYTSDGGYAGFQSLLYDYTLGDKVMGVCKDIISKSDSSLTSERRSSLYNIDPFDLVKGRWSVDDRDKHGNTILFAQDGFVNLFVEHSVDGGYGADGRLSNISVHITLAPPPNSSYFEPYITFSAEGVYSNTSGDFCLVGCYEKYGQYAMPTTWEGDWVNDSIASTSSVVVVPVFQSSEPSFPVQVDYSSSTSYESERDEYMRRHSNISCSASQFSHNSVNVFLHMHGSRIDGRIESTLPTHEADYFRPVLLNLRVITVMKRHYFEIISEWTESVILIVEFFCILIQLFYMDVHPDRAPWISISMVFLNVGIDFYRWTGVVYEPRPWGDNFNTDVLITPTAPRILQLAVSSCHGALLLSLWRSRRRLLYAAPASTQAGGRDLPVEWTVLVLCVPFYTGAILVGWLTNSVQLVLEVARLYFLLPQIVANVIWGGRIRALHSFYSGGITMALAAELLFIYYRDNFVNMDYKVATLWCLGNPVVMVFLLCLVHSQQSSWGGRWFLPCGYGRFRAGGWQPINQSVEEIGLVGTKRATSTDAV